MNQVKAVIESGKAVLGIEFGSTRIKAVLTDNKHQPIASGSYGWENRLENGFWTYSLEDIWTGLQESYRGLAAEVRERYDSQITRLGAIGFSAMMHGYMAFDQEGNLLVPFRTWRNSTTGLAAEKLTQLFSYPIPQRWSIAHLYQAILNGEDHVEHITYLTTLAGYIHWKLTGRQVLGIGDASGMFPIDSSTKDYHASMVQKFDELIQEKQYPWTLSQILPKVLTAGEEAGTLTEEGAGLLDTSGKLQAGVPLCPPEGDAGTGMAATNSVGIRTGNVSAGTSVFAMVVLEKELQKVHPEIDLVTTPDGSLVGMVHANNCTSDLNAWVGLLHEFAQCFGMSLDMDTLYETLFRKALEGDRDCGGLLSYGYLSGENITDVSQGRPLFVRRPDSHLTLANFMRVHLFSALGALKIGMDILLKEEKVSIDTILGHGGLFKTPGVGQKILAAAINTPVSVMDTAGEGGPWGMALLASYMINRNDGESLQDYLTQQVFAGNTGSRQEPDMEDVAGFEAFMERYRDGIGIEKAAEELL
ncbi:MAG: FGGY-family carbohydrate kinase [Lachnospiraceae bacterium]|nr:FGGY-family carbohydrate kinase [Lachnospiraceae bacterium]